MRNVLTITLVLVSSTAFADKLVIDDEGKVEIRTNFDENGKHDGGFVGGGAIGNPTLEPPSNQYRALTDRYRAMSERMGMAAESRLIHAHARKAEADALRKEMENWDFGVHLRWKVRDEAILRRQMEFDLEHSLDARHARLDKLEQIAALRQREEELKKKGILPDPEPEFRYNGESFESFAAFKESPAYEEWQLEKQQRVAEDLAEAKREEARRAAAVKFEARRRRHNLN